MFHLTGWEQSFQSTAALTAITAVQDPVLTTSGNDIRVPTALPNIVGTWAAINDASGSRAQFQSPSLRAMANIDHEPIVLALLGGNEPKIKWHGDSPIPVQPNESLNVAFASAAAGPVMHRGLVWLSDGPIVPVKGSIYTVRATSAITLATGTWVNGNLTFSQTLPAGSYQIVGMRARGANMIAARLVFVGGMFRPGVMAVNLVSDDDSEASRYGEIGVFGQFDSTTPPTVDCLGITDNAQVFDFDLIRIK